MYSLDLTLAVSSVKSIDRSICPLSLVIFSINVFLRSFISFSGFSSVVLDMPVAVVI